MKKLLIMLISFVIIPSLYANLDTGQLHPDFVEVCGESPTTVTVSALNFQNTANVTLHSLSASLHLTGTPGLKFLTSQNIELGDVGPFQSLPVTLSWTLACDAPNEGIYNGYVNFSADEGYYSTYPQIITVLSVHTAHSLVLNISLERQNPANESSTVITTNKPTLIVTTKEDAICKGSLDNDEPYSTMDFVFYGLEKNHTYSFPGPISDGGHVVFVRCQDKLGNIMQSSHTIVFFVDATPPKINIISPGSIVVGDYTELKIKVDESANCRYSDDDDNYDNMNEFSKVYANTYETPLSKLRERSYEYYIICKDAAGNIDKANVGFKVEYPPTAVIRLEKDSPLSEGTYELRLIPSKKLREVPELSYSFADEPSIEKPISLIQENNFYIGYLIIYKEEITRSGVFSFRGYDLNGNEGEEITQGALFLVDTISPDPIDSLEVELTSEGVQLNWFYAGEKPDHFNVYRSTSQGVGYIHFLDKAKLQSYLDDNIQKQLYYYRVAAVDSAGNVGALSKEASIYADQDGSIAATTINPPTQSTRQWRDTTLKNIENMVIDLDWALNNLKDKATKEAAVEELSLVKQVMSANEELSKLKLQVQNIDYAKVADTELRNLLSNVDDSIALIKKNTPQNLEVLKSSQLEQSLSDDDLNTAVKEVMKLHNYSQSQVNYYTKHVRDLNTKFKVETQIKTVKIEYLDERVQNRVLINKQVHYADPEPLTDILLYEVIPKTVAADISSIDFRTPNYVVINEDPVVSWRLSSLGYDRQSLTYFVLSDDLSESAKSSKTVLLLEPSRVIKPEGLLTGFTINLRNSKGIETLGLVLGLLMVAGLTMYYLVIVKEIKFPVLNFKNDEERHDLNPILASPRYYFYVRNGDVIRTPNELKEVIATMDDFTFHYHVQDSKNDFADWIEKVYKLPKYAAKIRAASTRSDVLKLLRK